MSKEMDLKYHLHFVAPWQESFKDVETLDVVSMCKSAMFPSINIYLDGIHRCHVMLDTCI